MIDKMVEVPPGIVAVHAYGWVLREDFDTVRPLVDEAVRQGNGIRALIYVDDTFAGISAGAMLEDLKLGLRAYRHWVGCAIVTPGWLHTSAWLAGLLVPWPVRTFDVFEMDAALRWLGELGERPGRSTKIAHGGPTVGNAA